jgi:hypothetical protein
MKSIKLFASTLLVTVVSSLWAQSMQQQKNDTSTISLNRTKILIISPKEEKDSTLTVSSDTIAVKPKVRYRHWAGIDLGINGLIDRNGSFNLNNATTATNPKENTAFMELDYRHSWQVNINFAEYFLKIVRHHFGIQTGLGFQMNNYELKNNVRLTPYGSAYVNDTVTEYNKFYTYGVQDSSITYQKNRFKTMYLTAPLLLEFNSGEYAKKSFHFAIGGLFGYNIQSKMKYVYNNDGKNKTKDKRDFNVNPIQLSAIIQIGYRKVQFFATYGLTPLFSKYKGPELYPVAAGIKLTAF